MTDVIDSMKVDQMLLQGDQTLNVSLSQGNSLVTKLYPTITELNTELATSQIIGQVVGSPVQYTSDGKGSISVGTSSLSNTTNDQDVSILPDRPEPLLSPSYNQGTWTATQVGNLVTFSCTVAHNIPSSQSSGVSNLGVKVYAKITNGAIKANDSDDGWYSNFIVTGAQTFTALSTISVNIATAQAVTPSSSYVSSVFTFTPQAVTIPKNTLDIGCKLQVKSIFLIPSSTNFANITSRAMDIRIRALASPNLTGHILSDTITSTTTTSATYEADVTIMTNELDPAFTTVFSTPTGVRSTAVRVATASNLTPANDNKIGLSITHTVGINDWMLLISNSVKVVKANINRDKKVYLTPITTKAIPGNFFGIHAANWPVNLRPNKTVTANGTAGQNTVTLSSADATILPGMNIVTQNAVGTAVGATVVSNVGTTLTFGVGQNNLITFAGKTLEVSGLTTSLGAVNAVNPSALGFSIFRTHDLGVVAQWYSLNPAPGVYYWSALDTVVNTIRAQGGDILFTVMGTPKWASARPLETGYAWGGRGHGAEPANMQYLADFIVALQIRYQFNYIEYLNEPNFISVTKACVGTSGTNSITCSPNSSGFPLGATVTGPGIPPYSIVKTNSSNIVTINHAELDVAANLTADLNGSVNFSGATSHFCSSTEAKAAEGMRIVSAAAKSIVPNCKVMGLALSNILATPTSTTWPVSYWTASASGYSYLGDTGSGKTAIDYMDIIAVHSYQADLTPTGGRIISQLGKLKAYMVANGLSINKEFWATEFGVNKINGLIGLSGVTVLTGTICSIGDTVIPTACLPSVNILANKWLKDPSGNRVGFIVSNSTTTITLAEGAYLALTGSAAVYSDAEIVTTLSRLIICMALAGFDRAFWYQWGSVIWGIDTKPAVYSAVAANIAAVKGKTPISVVENVTDGQITITFSDNTTMTI